MHLSKALGHQSNQIFYRGTKGFWVLSMKPATSHPSGTYNFEKTSRFLDNRCTPYFGHGVRISDKTLSKVPEAAHSEESTCGMAMSQGSNDGASKGMTDCVAICSTQRALCI